ncbi:MAG: hypothetical protein H6509_15950 [Bryobacterales bacterium]|nr:hypothetical protein [Bryobacterales bacterium]
MTIDDILLYIGIASGVGILALIIPGYVRKLLTGSPNSGAKSLINN